MDYDVVVIGAGHNGLTCACYLARAGMRVLVLEMAGRIGGAVHTAATIPEAPGYRFDTCSVVHNLIRMTSVPEELELAETGLEYVETDPFATAFLPGGDRVRFYRSVERTCEEIARFSARDARAYRRFIRWATPIMELSLERLRRSADDHSVVRAGGRKVASGARLLARSRPRRLASTLLGPYGPLLEAWFQTEHARMGVVPLAAHGTLGPQTPGTAFFACFQAAYHRYGNWHARGGSGSLAQALARRLQAWGGTVRTGAAVRRILGRREVEGVRLEDGTEITTRRVVAAINPQTALLELLGPERLGSRLAERLRSRHRSNAVQFVVHAALDRLPPWRNAPDDAWRGLQSTAASVAQVRDNFAQAEAGLAPVEPAVYVYTPSAIDPTLAPPGGHTAYVACASYPSRFLDGSTWAERGEREAHRLLDAVQARAPGFRDGIVGVAWRHAEDWEREIGLLGGHPMHLDITLDQVGPFRPLPQLSDHRTPFAGLYLSGAGTAPGGGVSAAPGRAAARALLADLDGADSAS
jgi:phytoene dehydrogenase-like protein